MKKFLALVKLFFTQQYKSITNLDEKNTKKRRNGTVVLIVVLALCFLPMLISVATSVYYLGKVSHGNVYAAGFLVLMCQGLVFVFGLHTIISNVFAVKDADKLLYLPVRVHTIFLAKLTVAYLNEVITTAVMELAVLLPFGIGAGASVGYYLMLLVALVTIPILPLFLGTVISMPMSALIARLSKNSSLKTVLRIVLYLLLMVGYIVAMSGLGFYSGSEGGIFDDPEQYLAEVLETFVAQLQTFTPYVHPNHMIVSAMLATNFLSWLGYFAATIGECVALFAVISLVSLPFYKWIIASGESDGSSAHRKGAKDEFRANNKGVIKQLIFTDFKRVARDSQVGFQSFGGIVIMPILIVVFYFAFSSSSLDETPFLEFVQHESMYQVIAPLVIMGYMTLLGITTNMLGLFPISRENKNVYMLKSLPVAFSKILLAKVIFATAVMLICDTVTCVFIVLLMGVKWYYGIAMLITMALSSFGAMCITTLLDLKEPKLGWSNFNQSFKNAKNSWIAMLIGLLTAVGVGLVSALFVVWYSYQSAWYIMLLMWLSIIAVSAVFAVVAYKIMENKAQRYFEQIEV